MKKIIEEKGWKMLNIILLISSILLFFAAELFWQSNCLGGRCTVSFMEGTLSSLKAAAIFLSIISLGFIFLPQVYFKHYVKVWLWWLLLLSYIVAVATDPVGNAIISFDRSQVVTILGGINLLIVAIFIFRFHAKQKKDTSSSKT